MNSLTFGTLGAAALTAVVWILATHPNDPPAADPAAPPVEPVERAATAEGARDLRSAASGDAPSPPRALRQGIAVGTGASPDEHPQLSFAVEASGLSAARLLELQDRYGVLDDLVPLRGLFADERHAAVVRQYLISVSGANPSSSAR